MAPSIGREPNWETVGQHITPYRNKSSLGRAARRVQSVMPDSPRKQQAIFTHLAPKVLGFSVQPQEKTKPTEKEVETLVKKYYVDDVISRVMPGKTDTMAIWVDGKKNSVRRPKLGTLKYVGRLHDGLIIWGHTLGPSTLRDITASIERVNIQVLNNLLWS